MALVIEFYVPKGFRKTGEVTPGIQQGKVLEFPPADKRDISGWAWWRTETNLSD